MSKTHLDLAVLISGGGSNLQAIIDACESPNFPAQVKIVISSTPDAHGITRAKNANIPTLALNYKNYKTRKLFEDHIQAELGKHDIDLICLAGFMRVLTPDFIARWPRKIINTHPSLLPKFGGQGMYGMHVHKAVLDANETVSGSTIHHVITEVDKGDIILQKRVAISNNETLESLAEKVQSQEHIAYPEAIKLIAEEKGLI